MSFRVSLSSFDGEHLSVRALASARRRTQPGSAVQNPCRNLRGCRNMPPHTLVSAIGVPSLTICSRGGHLILVLPSRFIRYPDFNCCCVTPTIQSQRSLAHSSALLILVKLRATAVNNNVTAIGTLHTNCRHVVSSLQNHGNPLR